MSDWFSSLANQALQFADNFADTLVSQATEAQLQIEAERKKLKDEEDIRTHKLENFDSLPWETDNESMAILSQELMERIFGLSVSEENFTVTAKNASEVYFNFKDFVPTAMSLLKLDSNLARMHSKLSPKMDEEVFWFNYYCRIIFLREYMGIEGLQAKENCKYKLSDIVYNPDHTRADLKDTSNQLQVVEKSLASVTNAVSDEEQTLAAEVHAALQQGVSSGIGEDSELLLDGDGSDDDLDLGDLDDLLDLEDEEAGASGTTGSDSYDKVGRSECTEDEELEAQIARELGN